MERVTQVKKQIIDLQVKQSIRDAQTKEHQSWSHQTVAEHFILNSFEKIKYYDHQQQEVTVKWYCNNLSRIEFSYGKTTLVLDKNQRTQFDYLTDFGMMSLIVQTDKIEFLDNQIIAEYQLLLENKTLGDYRFRLIYQG